MMPIKTHIDSMRVASCRRAEVDRLIDHARRIRNEDVPQALALSEKALTFAREIGYVAGQAYSLRNLTHSYSIYSNYEAALMHGLEGIQLFETLEDWRGLAQIVNLVSRIEWELGDYSEALTHTLRCLSLAEELGDQGLVANALNNSAGIYHQLNEHERALCMLHQALALHKATGDLQNYLFTLNNIALLNHQTGRHELALQNGLECNQKANELNSTVYKCSVLDTLGVIYIEAQSYEQALACLQEANDLAKANDLKRAQLQAQFNIGRIHYRRHDYESALSHLHQALASAEALDTTQQMVEIHQLLSSVYEACDELGRSLHHHKRFHELHTTLFNEKSDRKLKLLEVRHRTDAARKEAEIYRQRSVELEAAKNEAEEARVSAETANQAKSEFLSNMSHELRTPLNGILGYAQILGRDARLHADQIDAVHVIKQSGEHLLLLINDILDIAKIEARKVELHPHTFFVPSFLESVTGIIQMRARQKQLEFCVETTQLPQNALADEKRLRQVLLNLLSNAIKFTRRGRVTLRVSQVGVAEHDPLESLGRFHSRRSRVRLRFEIEDTGVGIASADLARIFLPFEQVGGLHLRAEGTGLGLAISQQLVELMGGRIVVESQLGQGSRFAFEIPLSVSGTALKNHVQPQPMKPPPAVHFVMPPAEDVMHLRSFVQLGDFGAIEQYCDGLAERDESFVPFAVQLRLLAHNFEDEAIGILLGG